MYSSAHPKPAFTAFSEVSAQKHSHERHGETLNVFSIIYTPAYSRAFRRLHPHPCRRVHRGTSVADPCAGRVLAREHGARVDRLALREHIWTDTAGRLLRLQPLDGGSVGSGVEVCEGRGPGNNRGWEGRERDGMGKVRGIHGTWVLYARKQGDSESKIGQWVLSGLKIGGCENAWWKRSARSLDAVTHWSTHPSASTDVTPRRATMFSCKSGIEI